MKIVKKWGGKWVELIFTHEDGHTSLDYQQLFVVSELLRDGRWSLAEPN